MNSASTTVPTDLTNERLPSGRLLALGLQHVLVMYAGTVAVPLIVGGALKLPKDQLAFLINADLFAAGLATLIQAIGFWKFGIRLPVMMGVTFASVAPMIAIGTDPNVGLLGIYGAVIASGIFGMLISPMMGRMLGLFPPVVTGTVITLIGVSLMRVGINWAAGGQPTTRAVIDGVAKEVPNLAYGDLTNLGIAGLTLVTILLLTKYGRGLVANCAVLLGINQLDQAKADQKIQEIRQKIQDRTEPGQENPEISELRKKAEMNAALLNAQWLEDFAARLDLATAEELPDLNDELNQELSKAEEVQP